MEEEICKVFSLIEDSSLKVNNSFPESKTISQKGRKSFCWKMILFSKSASKQISESVDAEVTSCSCIEDAEQILKSFSFDFALMDLNLPDGESLDLLRDQKIPSNTLTILMTAEGGIQSAVEAMQLGATDYLSKPLISKRFRFFFLNLKRKEKINASLSIVLKKEERKQPIFILKVLSVMILCSLLKSQMSTTD